MVASESLLLVSSELIAGVKVRLQVSLSLLVIVERVPVGVPLSRLGIVMSSSLLKRITASEKTSVTVALSPIFNSVSDIVKLSTVNVVAYTL